MKRVLILVLLISIVSVGYSQKKKKKKGKKDPTYFSLAIKGGYGNSILANTNITDDETITPDVMAPSHMFGADIGVNFNGGLGIGLELSSQTFGGSYEMKTLSSGYTKDITLTSFDKILLLRTVGYSGGYFEIGPKFSSIKSFSEANSNNVQSLNTISSYSKSYTSLVAGFGIGIFGVDRFNLSIGLRVAYSFTDIMNDKQFPIYDTAYLNTSEGYKSTNPLTAQAILKFTWNVGYFDTSACKRNTQFLLF